MNPSPRCDASPHRALIDADHPDVVAYAREHAVGANDRERAVSLCYAVRDDFRYDPYRAPALLPAAWHAWLA